MPEKILPGLYRIEVPLPRNPLKALNSYLIQGPDRWLLIDTGMNREECRTELFAALADLKVDLKKTDFFITHLHADHMGLVGDLVTPTSRVFFNEKESYINDAELLAKNRQETDVFYLSNGFPPDEFKKASEQHPGRRYGLKAPVPFQYLREGDKLEIGDFSFRCLETPGHSPGHACLYEPQRKILFSGDHIIFDITPNITWWSMMPEALGQYLASLEKVYQLEVGLVLPGHRRRMTDHRQRIEELRAHHHNRCDEVLGALRSGAKNAYQVAPYITWDIRCSSWESFPVAQKWFAVGETLAHLKYLEALGQIKAGPLDGIVYYSLA